VAKAHAELVDAASKLLESNGVSTAAIDQLNAAKRSFHAACSAAMQLLVRLACMEWACCDILWLGPVAPPSGMPHITQPVMLFSRAMQDGAVHTVRTQERSSDPAPALAEQGDPVAAVRAALRNIETSAAAAPADMDTS